MTTEHELPEPAPGPTDPRDESLLVEADACLLYGKGRYTASPEEVIAFARRVMLLGQHYVHPDAHRPEPIALSDRLPGPEDCDAEGRCWVFDQGDAVTEPAWNLTSAADLQDLRQMESEGTLIGLCERWRLAWLPFHALPLPNQP